MVAVPIACSDSTDATPTENGDSGAWEEYEAFCSEAAQEALDDNGDYTNGEVSTFYAGLVERMGSIDPPAEVADWHDRVLEGWTAVKRLIDAEPQDAIFDPLMLFTDSELLSLFGEVEEAFNEIPADVRGRLVAAGCTADADSEPTGERESDTPQPDATTTADSGEAGDGTEGDNEDCDPFLDDLTVSGSAGVGTPAAGRYRCQFASGTVSTGTASLKDDVLSTLTGQPIEFHFGGVEAPDTVEIRLYPRLEDQAFHIQWQGGDDWFAGTDPSESLTLGAVRDASHSFASDPGDYTLVVRATWQERVEVFYVMHLRFQLEFRPARPTNVRYAVEGSAIRVSWDPVEGADYYNLYHGDFFDSSCRFDGDGSPSFCEELTTSVVDTSYVHTDPSSDRNYYWVVACNSGGCSDIDSENPAQQIGSGLPGADSSAATPEDTPTPQPVATQTATPTVTPGPTSDTPIPTTTSWSARDRDGDGLIEVDNLTQLDAIRWDTDGDGISDNADYAAAFSDADTGAMCSVANCAGYELTANLDFDTNGNGEADEGDVYWSGGGGWVPIGESNRPFDTTFEGGGRTISNLYIRRSPNVGLFGVLGAGSTVSGIGLVDASVAASGYGAVGALAGVGLGAIEDSYADGLVAGCVDHIGGLVGLNEGSIENSRTAGNVASARRSGGSASGVITDLVNDLVGFPLFGSESRTCYASGGGLVGGSSGAIAGSHSTSVVSGFTDTFGGLAGVNSGTITDSYATGKVSAKACGDCFPTVGGLVGDNEIGGELTNSYATGGVSGQGDNFGGLAGVNSGVIAASYATGSVSGNGYADVGGLVGDNEIEGKVITSYATGGVSGQGDNFGGLAGVNSGVIAASYATGSVSGRGYADVGGLVGDNRYTGVITAAYAEGSVSGNADNYGGLVGSNQGVVTVCFSAGEVPQNGGGLIERNGNYGAVANCYWDTETSDQSDSAGGDDKTTAELQSPTGYTGPYADWNVDLDGDGSSDDPWIFGSATEYPILNLGILDIDHGNLSARPPLEPKSNAALCLAVSNGQIEEVNAQIEAGIDVNDTCQTTTLWYNGLTPLAIAKDRGWTDIEAILVESGAVDAEG